MRPARAADAQRFLERVGWLRGRELAGWWALTAAIAVLPQRDPRKGSSALNR